VGCVPKKLMTYGAHFLHDVHGQSSLWRLRPCLQYSDMFGECCLLSLPNIFCGCLVLCLSNLTRRARTPPYPCTADAQAYGWDVPQAPQLHWSRFIENKNKEIERLNGIYTGILTRAGVEIIRGKGTFVDAHTVSVVGEEGEKRVTAKTILIAVGGWPFVPDIPGKELVSVCGGFAPLVSLT
jgi:pyruvate/2-oxoglutarate dehydrogenase complex dihydrolipoamide dehydrogenase (E3) component